MGEDKENVILRRAKRNVLLIHPFSVVKVKKKNFFTTQQWNAIIFCPWVTFALSD